MKDTIKIAIVGLGQVGNYLYNELKVKQKDIELKTGKKINVVAVSARNILKKRRFKVFMNEKVEEILVNDKRKVIGVRTTSGRKNADYVILSSGVVGSCELLLKHNKELLLKQQIGTRIQDHTNIRVNVLSNTKIGSLNEIYESNIQGDFSHAEDICNAIYLLIKKKINFDNLILSSSKKTKINSIINHLIKKYNKSIKITKKPKKNKFYLIGNNKLAKKKLNWKIKKNIFIAADEIFNNNKKNSL